MMTIRISFEVPDWVKGRHIYLFAGTELLGKKEFRKEKIRDNRGNIIIKNYYLPIKLKVKPQFRCNGCGDCCSTGGSPFSQEMLSEIQFRLNDYQWQGSGTKCPLLDNNGCIMKGTIPFSCAKSNCEGWSENCSEKLIELEVD